MPVKKKSSRKSQVASSQIKVVKNIVEKQQQIFKSRVVSIKTLQTATVLLESRKTHPLYKKSYAHSKKYLVQDDLGVKLGDLVEIIKCRPMSKNKHFKIIKVVGRDIEAIVTEKIQEDVKRAIKEVIPEKSESQSISESEQNANVPTSQSAETPKHRNAGKLKKERSK